MRFRLVEAPNEYQLRVQTLLPKPIHATVEIISSWLITGTILLMLIDYCTLRVRNCPYLQGVREQRPIRWEVRKVHGRPKGRVRQGLGVRRARDAGTAPPLRKFAVMVTVTVTDR